MIPKKGITKQRNTNSGRGAEVISLESCSDWRETVKRSYPVFAPVVKLLTNGRKALRIPEFPSYTLYQAALAAYLFLGEVQCWEWEKYLRLGQQKPRLAKSGRVTTPRKVLVLGFQGLEGPPSLGCVGPRRCPYRWWRWVLGHAHHCHCPCS